MIKEVNHFLVEENELRFGVLHLSVWEPVKKGRFYREVQFYKGRMFGKINTKMPYIKNFMKLTLEERAEAKENFVQKNADRQYEILKEVCDEKLKEPHMIVEGEVYIRKGS